MPTSHLDLSTSYGSCPTEIFTPEGAGPWPAVIVCFDAGGARAAISDIAARIASWGYVAAVPNFYHHVGSPFDLLPAGKPHDLPNLLSIFGDDALRGAFMSRFYAPTLAYEHLRAVVEPLLDQLAARPDVRGGVGTTGYCMGGNLSLRLATIFGARIAASASFHGGGLVSPTDDSPHLRVSSIRARVYVAGAIEDATFPDEAKAALTGALETAGVKHTVETYPARHGFAVRDNPTYDSAAAERHYAALESLFAATLQA